MPLQHIGSSDDERLQDVADTLATSHKILMITGAGISTSCGIPDFRSKDGLYSLLENQRQLASNLATECRAPIPSRKRKLSAIDDSLDSSQESTGSISSRSSISGGRVKGKDLFDARVWNHPDSAATFFTFIASLRKRIQDDVKHTSQTHKFIRALRDGGRLIRCYTQNIDGLEGREGLTSDLNKGRGSKRRFMKKLYESPRPESVTTQSDYDSGCEVVPLHGDLDELRCNLCQTLVEWRESDTDLFLQGEAPECESCNSKAEKRRDSGKRGLSVGLLRPNIVLYQEQHPAQHLLAPLPPFDIAQGPDVLIIMGTSLKVHGLQNLVREFSKAVHNRRDGRVVFVNRTKPSESIWNDFIDDWIAMDCDDWVDDLRVRREDLWLRQGEYDLKAVKSGRRNSKKQSRSSSVSPVEITDTTQSSVTVSVVIDNSESSNTTIQEQPKLKRRKKKATATPQNSSSAAGLPTPPPSDGGETSSGDNKICNHNRPSSPSATTYKFVNHTPWLAHQTSLPASSLPSSLTTPHRRPFSPSTPSYSPIRPLMQGSYNTPWRSLPHDPHHSKPFRQNSRGVNFTIYQDLEPPKEISPIKEREYHLQRYHLGIKSDKRPHPGGDSVDGILSERRDTNTRIPVAPGGKFPCLSPADDSTGGNNVGAKPIKPLAPSVKPRDERQAYRRKSGLAIHELLN